MSPSAQTLAQVSSDIDDGFNYVEHYSLERLLALSSGTGVSECGTAARHSQPGGAGSESPGARASQLHGHAGGHRARGAAEDADPERGHHSATAGPGRPANSSDPVPAVARSNSHVSATSRDLSVLAAAVDRATTAGGASSHDTPTGVPESPDGGIDTDGRGRVPTGVRQCDGGSDGWICVQRPDPTSCQRAVSPALGRCPHHVRQEAPGQDLQGDVRNGRPLRGVDLLPCEECQASHARFHQLCEGSQSPASSANPPSGTANASCSSYSSGSLDAGGSQYRHSTKPWHRSYDPATGPAFLSTVGQCGSDGLDSPPAGESVLDPINWLSPGSTNLNPGLDQPEPRASGTLRPHVPL